MAGGDVDASKEGRPYLPADHVNVLVAGGFEPTTFGQSARPLLGGNCVAVERAKHPDGLVYLAGAHVAVYVGGNADRGVAEYPAHYLQLGASPQHLGSEEVPQLVWRKGLDAGPEARPLQRPLDIVYVGVSSLRIAWKHE